LFDGPARFPFAGNQKASDFVGDLERRPHAFVLACIMDRQINAERAWAIPYLMSKRLGGFSFSRLSKMGYREIRRAMGSPTKLHRYVDTMSRSFHDAIGRIATEYAGDASRIWADRPSSADLVYRFLQFNGVGPKIATMAANILARNFKIPLADYYSIDVSADVHIKRVFFRLGLVNKGASVEEVVYRARSLHPTFPGLMDLPAWQIGREWCHQTEPECGGCFMNELCPTASGHVS
jgi:endonuclease III